MVKVEREQELFKSNVMKGRDLPRDWNEESWRSTRIIQVSS